MHTSSPFMALVIAALLPAFQSLSPAAAQPAYGLPAQLVEAAWHAVDSTYYDATFGGVDWDGVRREFVNRDYADTEDAYAAIRAMLARLGDRATRFLTPMQSAGLQTEFAGASHVGVGLLEVLSVDVDDDTGAIVVVTPVAGAPASRAGLRPGDVIASIGGEPAARLGLAAVAERLRGEVSTTVALTIRRAGRTFPMVLTRERLGAVVPVEAFVRDVRDVHIGYLGLRQFTPDAGEAFVHLLDSLRSAGAEAYVLDLRDDPGGYVPALATIAGALFGDVSLAAFQRRADMPDSLRSQGRKRIDAPLAVLIDEGTASAAEVLASALQHYGRATLFGAHTFGKGLAHGLVPLPDGSAVLPTVGRLVTLDGRDILTQGILPDVTVPTDTSPVLDPTVDVGSTADTPFGKAVDYLVAAIRPASGKR